MFLKMVRDTINRRIDELEDLAMSTHRETTAYAKIKLNLMFQKFLFAIFN